ncbi:MAG: ribonuclease E/G, partial [Mailhella sp.]
MSQNPVLTEENIESSKPVRTRRTRKTSAEENTAAEKKSVRRTRKKITDAAAEQNGAEEEKISRHLSSEKREEKTTELPAEQTVPQEPAQEKKGDVKKTRTRRASSKKKTVEPSAVSNEETLHIGSAIILDDILSPSSLTLEPAENNLSNGTDKKRRTRKKPVLSPENFVPSSEETPKETLQETVSTETEKKTRTRRTSGRKKQEAPAEPSDSDNASPVGAPTENTASDPISRTSAEKKEESANKTPAQATPEETGSEDPASRAEKNRRMRRTKPSALLAEKTATATALDDNIGNRAESSAPSWFDDSIVTNILPYPGEVPEASRLHPKNRRRKNREAQPVSNASPYLTGTYQQSYYDPAQALVSEPPFGNRKNRINRKKRRGQFPSVPEDFDYNAAILNNSVLGVALGQNEDDFFPADDGPQPALPDQPVAIPLSSGEMADEDLAALDAAVNGNRIDEPHSSSTQKDTRPNRKNKKTQLKEEHPAPLKEKKFEAEEENSPRRILYVSVVPEEQTEVVITENGQVTEYFVEMAHQVKIRGNIYKGIINNIDTNLQAAFVNFGNGKNGFLQIDEVHPEYYLVPHDAVHGPKYPPIQKVLKVGQEVLVQVVKEPAGSKGAFLTTWISIAGRFLVLTPGQEQIGVSRKVEDPEERTRLKDLLNGIQPGENMGVIIRTASEGASKSSIQQDLQYLKKLWKDIQKKAPLEKSPSLIYQEADLAARAVRDYLSEDIVEIWTDDEHTKARIEDTASLIFPDKASEIVKLHKDQRQSMWERFNLLRQLETFTSREVVLPSGGR